MGSVFCLPNGCYYLVKDLKKQNFDLSYMSCYVTTVDLSDYTCSTMCLQNFRFTYYWSEGSNEKPCLRDPSLKYMYCSTTISV